MSQPPLSQFDAVVVGGGPAGLNGALILARSRRSVVVVDAGEPRNGPAEAAHGLFARDGIPPVDLLATGREEVRRVGGRIIDGEVVGVRRTDTGLEVSLADETTLVARRLLVTTGLVDMLPELPGIAEGWGKDVIHCPYCHGYEVRDRKIAVLGISPASTHQALMFRQLSSDVVYFIHTWALSAEDRERFDALGIAVVEGEVTEILRSDGGVTGIRTADGVVAREVVAISSRMEVRGGFLDGIGLNPIEHPSGMGTFLPSDGMGRSEAEGVWLAGNVTDLTAQVGAAAAAGALAGAQINADLIAVETEDAVRRHRTA
ncbi:NAD(P)/FAD-dependent oxidoreductase [Amycolatopsis thailandensis]|uniref:NAD(P)/FAD-dependent oxidoreductase n=1 Tax=Amycolatopsis thailandensis TaxID=589330 RepID=UPI003634910D